MGACAVGQLPVRRWLCSSSSAARTLTLPFLASLAIRQRPRGESQNRSNATSADCFFARASSTLYGATYSAALSLLKCGFGLSEQGGVHYNENLDTVFYADHHTTTRVRHPETDARTLDAWARPAEARNI